MTIKELGITYKKMMKEFERRLKKRQSYLRKLMREHIKYRKSQKNPDKMTKESIKYRKKILDALYRSVMDIESKNIRNGWKYNEKSDNWYC